MTLIVGYRGEYLSIVMADDRVTYRGVKDYYEDGHTKLVNLPDMGWAVASGLSLFIEEYKNALATNKIKLVEDIMTLYTDSVAKAVRDMPDFYEDITKSEILATWIGTEKNLNEVAFHVGVVNESKIKQDSLSVVNKNNLYIGYPYGFSTRKMHYYNEKHSSFNDEGNLTEVLKYLLQVFYDISSQSQYANTYCDIGIHVLSESGVYKMKLSGESKYLLEHEDLSTLYEVVSEITR